MKPESEVNPMIFSTLLIVPDKMSRDARNPNLACLVLENSRRSNIMRHFL